MTDNTTFAFDFGGIQLRAMLLKNPVWFLAADACRALGFKPSSKGGFHNHLRGVSADQKSVRLCPRQFVVGGRGGFTEKTELSFLTEAGLYMLVLRAQRSNPAAAKFQDWVTGTVLPAIRKDGAYVMGEEKAMTYSIATRTGDITTYRRWGLSSLAAALQEAHAQNAVARKADDAWVEDARGKPVAAFDRAKDVAYQMLGIQGDDVWH